MVDTAAKLRRDDEQDLRAFAGSETCPLCAMVIGPHHPLLCQTVNHRGTAHDNIVNKLSQELDKNPKLSVRANKNIKTGRCKRSNGAFRPDLAIQQTGQVVEVKTLNADTHGGNVAKALFSAATKAHVKYMREIRKVPLVITTTTDGFMSAEGFRSLKALDNTANRGKPVAGPRLSLLAGFALCEAASWAYATWYWQAAVRAARARAR